MSPGVRRARTAFVVQLRRAQFGEHHRATWAAFARAHVAWGGWNGVRGGAPELPVPVVRVEHPGFGPMHLANPLYHELTHAYTTADLRARGAAGLDNRHDRKRRARKLVQSLREIPPEYRDNGQGYRAVMK